MKLSLLLLFLPMVIDSNPLDPYHWESRVILIFANQSNQDAVEQQLKLFEQHQQGLQERDLVVFRIFDQQSFGPEGKLTKEAESHLRKRFQPQGDYTIVLVGKDGGEKLRRQEVLPIEKLFNTIDAMPMRQAEMRQRN